MYAYCYDKNNIFCGEEECHLDILESAKAGKEIWLLPSNATFVAPPDSQSGFVLHWTGTEWEQVEDHKGKSGYVNGELYEIEEYGPLPKGWSETLPPPTVEELFDRLRSFRNAYINSVLWMRERHADEIALGKETTLTSEQYTALLTYVQALRDLPTQVGAPWDGGGELTPWPIKPV